MTTQHNNAMTTQQAQHQQQAPQHDIDRRLMLAAISLAKSAEGSTYPNPPVGCIIAHHSEIIAFSATAPSGRPHAETQALDIALNIASEKTQGAIDNGATLYTTLEPCTHINTHNTPSCVEAIVNSNISRLCYALKDPDPRTHGKSKSLLEKANISVTENLCVEEATQQLAPYRKRCLKKIPLCTLKLAASLDGKIAAYPNSYPTKRTLLSGIEARLYRNDLLRRSDAVLIGARTMRFDNPRLLMDNRDNLETDNLETDNSEQTQAHKNHFAPIRIVLDGGLTLPLESKLVQTIDQAPLWILTREAEAKGDKGWALKNSGVRLIPVPAVSSQGGGVRLSLQQAFHTLAEEGIASVLCEGGAFLAHALLRANLVDRLILFSAPHTLGSQALSMLEGVDAERVDFRLEESLTLGKDEVRIFQSQQQDQTQNQSEAHV